jgi:DNA invertase Pin-like site-specific DNA recombinase
MKAFSYLRYSSPEQAQGDTIRRQLEDSRKYAADNGLDLDESLQADKGISAFHGKNRTEGNLGAFLADVKAGRVPKGSALLVESLDRLSREEVETAMFSFLDLIRAGIEIHTVSDRQVYKKGQLKTEQLILSLFVMSRANEESERKSDRVSAAWDQKHRNAKNGLALTANVPAWLKAKKGQRPVVIPERVAVVKEIFRLAGSGMGRHLITRQLNERGIPTFGKSKHWWDSSVRKILGNRAVLGEYQPCKYKDGVGTPEGEPILDFFPKIISAAEWQAAHVNSKPSAGQVGRKCGNLFTGLVYDADLNCKMFFDNKANGHVYLTSDSSRLGIKPHYLNYDRFERLFLEWMDQLDWTTVIDTADQGEIREAEEQIAHMRLDLGRSQQQAQKIFNLLTDTPSRTLKDNLLKEEAKQDSLHIDIGIAEGKLEQLRLKHRDLMDRSVLFTELSQSKDFETRFKLRSEVRRKVALIQIFFHEAPGKVTAAITFHNGAIRDLVLGEDSAELITYPGYPLAPEPSAERPRNVRS